MQLFWAVSDIAKNIDPELCLVFAWCPVHTYQEFHHNCHVDVIQHLQACGIELLIMQGAIYATDNGAYSWSAAVQETVDATLNRTVSSGISGASYYEGTFSTIQRSPAGDYVAVSSRGNALPLRPGMHFVTCTS